METRLRLLIVLAGLPEPLVDVRLEDGQGSWRRRFDLYYPGIKLIVEYDGRQHADDSKQWNTDLVRREEFDDDGFRVLVVTAEGIYVNPLRTIERVERQLVRLGFEGPIKRDERWRDHFGA